MALQEVEDESQQQQQPKRTKAFETLQNLQSIHIFSSEIEIEILSRLPIESLLRCKSVCKSWRSLISDPHFIKFHLSLSNTNNEYAHHRLIICTGRTRVEWCPFHDVIYDKSMNTLELDYPLKHPQKTVWIVGSCNGLLCINVKDYDQEGTTFIWNPSTRQSNRLPCSGFKASHFARFGFGHDESSDDYKVVSIAINRAYAMRVMIYSLKSGNWKRIGDFPLGFCIDYIGKFSNGALHWAAYVEGRSYSPWTIISLDLATETYGEVLQPVYDEGDKDLRFGVMGECLFVVCNYSEILKIDVWVMKVYGVKDSWTKFVSIQNLTGPPTDRVLGCITIANDGTILLQCSQTLVLYDVKNGTFSRIKSSDRGLVAWSTVESLVLPYALQDS